MEYDTNSFIAPCQDLQGAVAQYPANQTRNISWREHKTKNRIYGDIPLISVTVAQRRVQFAGHCYCAKDPVIPDWRLLRLIKERYPLNYTDIIGRHTQSEIEDLPNMMRDKHL